MIDMERLKSRILTMADIGKTDKGGVTRLALSEEDKEGRLLLMHWMREIGLDVRVDDMGNLYGRKEGKDPDAPVVMTGSHLDSVPKGGKFDGALGVLGALEAVETIIRTGMDHRHPIEIVSFTNEEGARFTPQMLGSGAVTGEFSKPFVYDRMDKEGLRFADELKKIGFMGNETNRLHHVKSFIELHIEQGPVLESEGYSIGVVEGISGFYWMEISILGQSSHSATTPMNRRKDSLVAACKIIDRICQWTKSREDETTSTVGQIQAMPGIVNAVPGKTVFTVDIRHPKPEKLQQAIEEMKQLIGNMAHEESMDFSIKEIWTHNPTRFSTPIVNLIADCCDDLQLPYKRMMSGAGHDAMYLSQITDTAMIFVPSREGKSHCEEEETSWQDIEKGTQLLYTVLCQLAK